MTNEITGPDNSGRFNETSNKLNEDETQQYKDEFIVMTGKENKRLAGIINRQERNNAEYEDHIFESEESEEEVNEDEAQQKSDIFREDGNEGEAVEKKQNKRVLNKHLRMNGQDNLGLGSHENKTVHSMIHLEYGKN